MDSDRDLERLFREARSADERSAPSFVSVINRHPRTAKYSLGMRFAVVLAAVAVVSVGVWKLTTPNEPKLFIAFTPGDMRVPTDYLLDMATYPRAGEIPRLGASDWFALPLATDTGADTRRLP